MDVMNFDAPAHELFGRTFMLGIFYVISGQEYATDSHFGMAGTSDSARGRHEYHRQNIFL